MNGKVIPVNRSHKNKNFKTKFKFFFHIPIVKLDSHINGYKNVNKSL